METRRKDLQLYGEDTYLIDWTALLLALSDQGVQTIAVAFSGTNIDGIYFEPFDDIELYDSVTDFVHREVWKYTGKFFASRNVSSFFVIRCHTGNWSWNSPAHIGHLMEGSLEI